LSLDFHCCGGDLKLGNSAITSSENEVSVSEQLHAVDTLGEQGVAGTDTLKQASLEVDLDDVASKSAQVGARIIWSDHNALVDSLDLAQSEVLEENFLLGVVDVPDADSVVVDGDKLLIGVVVESDLVGDVHANGVTTNGFSTDGLIYRDKRE